MMLMPKLLKLSLITLLWLSVFSLAIVSVQAQPLVPPPTGQLPANTATELKCSNTHNCGNYTLNDMLSVLKIVADFILVIVGSLALLALIIGGLMWLLSGGKAEMVERGKQTIVGAVLGLAIVFTSYMIIQLVFSALGIPGAESGKWATSDWFSESHIIP
jgi:hypothetical protein